VPDWEVDLSYYEPLEMKYAIDKFTGSRISEELGLQTFRRTVGETSGREEWRGLKNQHGLEVPVRLK
jgi:hypothetical protein